MVLGFGFFQGFVNGLGYALECTIFIMKLKTTENEHHSNPF